ncbi:arsenate reductase ArsC [Planctomycetota bacterium]
MADKHKKLKILFVCTANATRSQMAEAWARTLKADCLDVYSAGVQPLGRVISRTVRAMAEVGIDIADQWSKPIDQWAGLTFDYVITLCEYAHEVLPDFPSETRVVNHPIPDPTGMMGTNEQVLQAFRKAREIVRQYIETLPESLPTI